MENNENNQKSDDLEQKSVDNRLINEDRPEDRPSEGTKEFSSIEALNSIVKNKYDAFLQGNKNRVQHTLNKAMKKYNMNSICSDMNTRMKFDNDFEKITIEMKKITKRIKERGLENLDNMGMDENLHFIKTHTCWSYFFLLSKQFQALYQRELKKLAKEELAKKTKEEEITKDNAIQS